MGCRVGLGLRLGRVDAVAEPPPGVRRGVGGERRYGLVQAADEALVAAGLVDRARWADAPVNRVGQRPWVKTGQERSEGGHDLADFPGGRGLGESGIHVPTTGGSAVGHGVQTHPCQEIDRLDCVGGGLARAVAILGIEVQGEHRQAASGVPQHHRCGNRRHGRTQGALRGLRVGGAVLATYQDAHGRATGDRGRKLIPLVRRSGRVCEVGQGSTRHARAS